jgi:Protein kinase domain
MSLSEIALSPSISVTFRPGELVDQLASLAAMGVSCRVEIDLPGGGIGSIRILQGELRAAHLGSRRGLGALTTMAVAGLGTLRLFPEQNPATDELGVLTPVLLDLLREDESRLRLAPPPTAELPRPEADGGQDGVLARADLIVRPAPLTSDHTTSDHTTSDSFPADWLGELIPEGMESDCGFAAALNAGTSDDSWEPPAVGGMLGRCYLGAEIGRGASAIVYRALHITLKVDVAVKVFIPTPDGLPALPLAEANLLARLSHPNVLRVLDCADEQPYPHLICEYVDGFTLAELIQRSGSLDQLQTLRMIIQAAEGLAYAAAQGIVHCDVKPGNLLVARQDGLVKLVDLGLARIAEHGHEQDGMISGTPAYISPEQVAQQPVTAKSDIYSLGCTLWHALVGQPPFIDQDPLRTMTMHILETPPALSAHLPQADSRLEHLLRRMLAKDPAQRPAYPELLSTLRGISERLEQSVRQGPFDRFGTRIFHTLHLAVDGVRRALVGNR